MINFLWKKLWLRDGCLIFVHEKMFCYGLCNKLQLITSHEREEGCGGHCVSTKSKVERKKGDRNGVAEEHCDCIEWLIKCATRIRIVHRQQLVCSRHANHTMKLVRWPIYAL